MLCWRDTSFKSALALSCSSYSYFADVHHLGIDKAAIISTLFLIDSTIGTLSVSRLVAGPFCCKKIGFAVKVFIGIGCLLVFFRFSWSYAFMTLAITAGLTALFLAVFAWWLKRIKDVRHEPAPQAI